MVIAISASRGGFRPMARVGQSLSFMRPVIDQDVLVRSRHDGRPTPVFGEIAMQALPRRTATSSADGADAGASAVVAHASATCALSG